AAAEAASARALRATRSAISDALASRSQSLRQLTAALVQVPAYVSRIGEALRTDDRGNLLDQADELRMQTGADWVLIVDGSGILFFSRDTAGVPTVAVATVAASGLRDAVRRLRVESTPGDSAPTRFRVAAAGHEYEGVTGLLQTADGVPIGGYVGLHDRQDE